MHALLLGLSLLATAHGQDWRPPEVERPRLGAMAPAGARPIAPAVVAAALARIPGEEALRVAAWAQGRDQLWLKPERRGWTLHGRGGSLRLSNELGTSVDRVRQYFGMTDTTLAKPITFEELTGALTSPAGVARVQALFEAMIRERVEIGGKVLLPERGGEATLDAGGEFKAWPAPTRESMRRLANAIDDEAELERLSREDAGVQTLDEHGLLKNLVSLLPKWHARGDAPEKVAKIRRLSVMTLLENGAETFVFDPPAQFEAILSHDWGGRYIGRWHLHPPHWTPGGFAGSEGPSPPDMEIAMESGQNLTIAFRPDGFDAYDLSELSEAKRVDLKLARVIRFRSAAWQRRFSTLHAGIPRP